MLGNSRLGRYKNSETGSQAKVLKVRQYQDKVLRHKHRIVLVVV